MNLEDKNILVLGLGRSGWAAAKLSRRLGAKVTAIDSAPADKIRSSLQELNSAGIEVITNTDSPVHLNNKELLVVSPGIPLNNSIIQAAKTCRIPVIGELEFASRYCQADIIALTGTNGKSTTCSLIGEILKTAGISNHVLGNIGSPFSDRVPLDAGAVVLEVSSYQLETTESFRPLISIWLNLTPDHLGRHGTMEVYAETKSRIFGNQQGNDVFVYNADDPQVSAAAKSAQCRLMPFSMKEPAAVWAAADKMKFKWDGKSGEIISVDEIRIRGRHNLENSLAAASAAIAYGIDPRHISEALKNFPGIEHRQEFIAEIDSVRYVNDSKATNLDSTLKALETIPAPMILIAGGRGKGESYNPAGDLVRDKVRTIIAIGETRQQIAAELSPYTKVLTAGDMFEAVMLAKGSARSGDTVILSPMCASFDMFADFEERGRVFKTIVKDLEHGEEEKK